MIRFLRICAIFWAVVAQGEEFRHIPITIEDVQRAQAYPDKDSLDLNERLRAMAGAARFSQDYVLGPGDVIEVTVFGAENLKQKELVLDSGGRVSLPFIKTVGLVGLTAREAELKIAESYESSIMKNPQVSVAVKEFRSQFLNVLGAVLKPGTYQLTRRTFLLDALSMAGGLLTEKAGTKAFVHRASLAAPTSAEVAAGTDQNEMLEVDLVQLLEMGDVSLNIPIYAGDIISVPERVERFYYVLGDVNRGGAFAMKKSEAITLTKALASAGGLMFTAKAKKSVIIRQTAGGPTEQIPINVSKVLKGEVEDMVLLGNDVVFVPGSTTKTIGRGFLNSIGGILNAFVYTGFR